MCDTQDFKLSLAGIHVLVGQHMFLLKQAGKRVRFGSCISDIRFPNMPPISALISPSHNLYSAFEHWTVENALYKWQ